MDDTASVLRTLLAFVWAPLLVLAGALDWACHRQQRIELTAGLGESLLHLLMIGVIGVALLAALLLEATTGLFLLLLLALLLHEASYVADLKLALSRRRIPAVEQWVHGFQHLLPWVGAAGLLALSPAQALAILPWTSQRADWGLRLRAEPVAWEYAVALVAAALVFNVVPFLSEAWRAARAQRRQPAQIQRER